MTIPSRLNTTGGLLLFARHAVKAWQARRHAERAFAYIEKEQWNEARTEAVAAPATAIKRDR